MRTSGEIGIVHNIATIKPNLQYQEMSCILLYYAYNNTGGTYRMLNLRTKRTVPSHGIIRLNKTHGDYVSRKEHTKAKHYILQDEDES